MNLKVIYSIFFTLSILVLGITAFSSENSSDPELTNKDLINFSHSLHADFVGCADCHTSVSQSTNLSERLLPDHDNCMDCHDTDDENECATCHKDDNYEPLIQTKSKLLFNHSIHITQELNCIDCHQGLTEVDYSFEAAAKSPAMELCASCHGETNIASNACESCHISTFDLIPQTHLANDFTKGHKFLAVEMNANCMMCHNNSTCDECHIATSVITETNASDNFYQPYMPSNTIDGNNKQIILKVHEDLNFRYSHGIDAKGKTAECQSCHQVESFCANCHQAEDSDFALSGIVPSSHLDPNFALFGVGSGGGEHSTLARRDIDNCTSCHDIQGADPTCVLCHLDSDGIKNTNPKTHVSDFMRNEKGDWHDSQGSICYNCHTSATPKSNISDGFCNYCHGL